MKKIYSTLIILISTLSYSQYISTTTSTTNYNSDIKHNGRILFGDSPLGQWEGDSNIHIGYLTNRNLLLHLKNASGRLEFALAGLTGAYDPIAKPGDGILRINKGKNFIFSSDNTVSTSALPGHSGVQRFIFAGLNDSKTMSIYNTGKITIGTDKYDLSGYRLFVKDGIKTERLKVEVATTNQWADFVFNDDYNLRPLNEVKKFIQSNKHLPEIPSADEIVKDGGIEQGELNAKLLQKIEELTLYLIQQNEKIENLEKEVESFKN